MFEFDAGKLIIIGIVALIVIGPKELPGVLRQVGHAVGKMRRMAAEFQGQFMEAMREADVADIKADVTKLAESAKVDVAFNPLADIKSQITSAIDGPPGESSVALGAETPALAAPGHDEASLNSIDLPDLPTTAAGGLSLADAGAAPASPGPEEGAPREAAPADGVEVEMKALASALEAEMAAAEPRQARVAEALGARAQEKA